MQNEPELTGTPENTNPVATTTPAAAASADPAPPPPPICGESVAHQSLVQNPNGHEPAPTLVLDPPPKNPALADPLNHLLNAGLQPGGQLALINRTQSFAVTAPSQNAHNQLPATNAPVAPAYKSRRRGRIASLPKIHRDMVSRMIQNGVPYKNIVRALVELNYSGINERNVSNWATGGYLEWKLEQDLLLQNRHEQDHLVDHLRREDASELPEVGLQAAALRLSQTLLQKAAAGEDVERNLGSFSKMVDLLCRLNREITLSQKHRDDSRRTLGKNYDPVRVKNIEETDTQAIEHDYTIPGKGSTLSAPDAPPLLMPESTPEVLNRHEAEEAEAKRLQEEDWERRKLNHVRAQSAAAEAQLTAQVAPEPAAKSVPHSTPSSTPQ